MKKLLPILIAFALQAQTPLSKEEKSDIEKAQLQLENIALRSQILKYEQEKIQATAQAVFDAACKRAGIEPKACQYDPKTASVSAAAAK